MVYRAANSGGPMQFKHLYICGAIHAPSFTSGCTHAVFGGVIDCHRNTGYTVDHGCDRTGGIFHVQISLALKPTVFVGTDREEQLASPAIDDLELVA